MRGIRPGDAPAGVGHRVHMSAVAAQFGRVAGTDRTLMSQSASAGVSLGEPLENLVVHVRGLTQLDVVHPYLRRGVGDFLEAIGCDRTRQRDGEHCWDIALDVLPRAPDVGKGPAVSKSDLALCDGHARFAECGDGLSNDATDLKPLGAPLKEGIDGRDVITHRLSVDPRRHDGQQLAEERGNRLDGAATWDKLAQGAELPSAPAGILYCRESELSLRVIPPRMNGSRSALPLGHSAHDGMDLAATDRVIPRPLRGEAPQSHLIGISRWGFTSSSTLARVRSILWLVSGGT